jgi:hypothetical protein
VTVEGALLADAADATGATLPPPVEAVDTELDPHALIVSPTAAAIGSNKVVLRFMLLSPPCGYSTAEGAKPRSGQRRQINLTMTRTDTKGSVRQMWLLTLSHGDGATRLILLSRHDLIFISLRLLLDLNLGCVAQ